jgi:hypothetical protein
MTNPPFFAKSRFVFVRSPRFPGSRFQSKRLSNLKSLVLPARRLPDLKNVRGLDVPLNTWAWADIIRGERKTDSQWRDRAGIQPASLASSAYNQLFKEFNPQCEA